MTRASKVRLDDRHVTVLPNGRVFAEKPVERRNRAIRKLLENGWKASQLAEVVGLSYVRVLQIGKGR